MKIGLIILLLQFFSLSTPGFAGGKASAHFRLSQVLADPDLTGFSLDTPEDQSTSLRRLSQYLSYKESRTETEEGALLAKNCEALSFEERGPYCKLVERLTREVSKSKRRLLAREKKQRIRQATHFIQSKKLQELSQYHESELNRALKSFRNIRSLEPFIQQVIASPSCLKSSLYFSLGIRVENEFPAQKYRELAQQLYEKAGSCDEESAAIQARYRLGLLRIWDGRCDLAEEALAKVPVGEPQSMDHRLRVSYWRYYCANQLGNESLKSDMMEWLSKEYPFSLHVLLAYFSHYQREPQPLSHFDPEIRFRSTQDVALNDVIRAVEGLLSRGDRFGASDLLRGFQERAQNLELPVRLYWAVLFRRSEDSPSTFQFMATLLKQHTQIISKVTLEVLYPTPQLDVIQAVKSPIDPFLVLALIRQESAFNERAKSSAGAFGLMQLQLPTARNFERVNKKQLFNPEVNIRVGMKYFSRLLSRYEGEVEFALAAYNAGPSRIKEWVKKYPVENRLLFFDLIPIRETRDYVSSIVRSYYWYLRLYRTQEPGRAIAKNQGPYVFQLLSAPK